MIVITVALIVGSVIAFSFEGEINTLLSPPIIDEDTLEASSASGQETSKRILQEGAILLKNAANEGEETPVLPLQSSVSKVNVFGWRSIDWIYGSEGQNASGGVAPETGDGEEHFANNIDIYDALSDYGIQYNTRLFDMYNRYQKPDHLSANLKSAHISTVNSLVEPDINKRDTYYTEDLLSYSKSFSDTAIVMISRMSGEGMEPSKSDQKKEGPEARSNTDGRHYLELTVEEEDLLKYCGQNFKNVIVLMNMANPFECGFLNTIEGVDACMYIGFTGTRAASVLPSLLWGDVSPSGRTVDTFAYDLFTNPANYWGNTSFSHGHSGTEYIENIYVGYKWYETANTMGFWNDVTNVHGTGFDGVVQFPFGHGKSYTKFDWTVDEVKILGADGAEGAAVDPDAAVVNVTDKSKIEFTVTVTNTGEHKGREVVEIYSGLPYTTGGIEKSSQNLVGFTKTNELEPGQSEQVKVVVDMYDLASYDCYDKNGNQFKGYELEAGVYDIKLMQDSHVMKEVTYKGAKKSTAFNFTVATDIQIANDPVTGQPVGNLFTGEDAVDVAPLDGSSKTDPTYVSGIPYFYRDTFAPMSEWNALRAASANRTVAPEVAGYGYDSYDQKWDDWDTATTDAFGNPVNQTKPTWGSTATSYKLTNTDGSLTELGEELGDPANWDSEKWLPLLQQITLDEAIAEFNKYYGSKAIGSIGKPFLKDVDGPAQIGGFVSAPRGTGYPTMVVLASTWNPKLHTKFGQSYGEDMVSIGVYGLWGWAIDCHRSAFFGRNHESPSEDGFLAGQTISNAVKGLNSRGRYCFLKHFALYTHNGGSNLILTEQSLREIYLKSFREAFVEGGALGCMTTYNGFGHEHCETTQALLTGVLRGEWAFKGAITTDYITSNKLAETLLRCGGDFGMGCAINQGDGFPSIANASGRVQNNLQQSMKHITYMWLRSQYNQRTYVPTEDDTFTATTSINRWVWWKPLIYTVNGVNAVWMALWATFVLVDFFMKDDKKQNTARGGNQ